MILATLDGTYSLDIERLILVKNCIFWQRVERIAYATSSTRVVFLPRIEVAFRNNPFRSLTLEP